MAEGKADELRRLAQAVVDTWRDVFSDAVDDERDDDDEDAWCRHCESRTAWFNALRAAGIRELCEAEIFMREAQKSALADNAATHPRRVFIGIVHAEAENAVWRSLAGSVAILAALDDATEQGRAAGDAEMRALVAHAAADAAETIECLMYQSGMQQYHQGRADALADLLASLAEVPRG